MLGGTSVPPNSLDILTSFTLTLFAKFKALREMLFSHMALSISSVGLDDDDNDGASRLQLKDFFNLSNRFLKVS